MTLERRYVIPPERKKRPLVYKNLTEAEAEVLTNGCGGSGSWFDPPEYVWNSTCRGHDLCYFVGGDERARKACDQEFYEDMVAQFKKRAWWRRPWLGGAAWRYWLAVRWFGGKFFHYGTPRTWDDVERIMQERLDRGQNR